MSSAPPFVHLHCHTDYSLLDGACEIAQLMDLVVEQKMPAVAMTDHGNLFGAVEFYNSAKQKGVHPVIGCEVYVSEQGHQSRSDTDRYNHLVLLCENQQGYRNLLKLVSTAFLEGFYYKPRIDKDLLAQHSEGLIAMSACLRGDINETLLANRYEEAKRLAYGYADMFGKDNFFLEIQDHGLDQDKIVTPQLHRLSQGNAHPAGRHQRLALHAQGRRARARNPAVHPDRQDHERSAAHAFHAAGVLSQDARRDAAHVRRARRRARPHLGNRPALPGETRKGQGAVPQVRRSRRAHHRQLFRVRRAPGIRETPRAPGSASATPAR